MSNAAFGDAAMALPLSRDSRMCPELLKEGVAMFEVGKAYEIRTLVDGGETVQFATIARYEHPLIQLASTGEIINVTSPHFISAVEKD
ncbi:hypothetical protein ABNQ39_06955 [Azospirillum sp. A26]|uniref:hypothetical protein n=1 Tax=Azospirillum sp. A26 TaxID=3160607 RepID=UPI003670EB8D